MSLMKRYTENKSVAITTGSDSPDIDISHFASGEVIVNHLETVVTLTYYVKGPDGLFYAAQDAAASAITQTVAADKAYPMPATLFGAGTIQIRGNVVGNLALTLKS